ncbi:Retrovirus-related Pol polyprotein from transposon TNT 1-94 [Quillaja saponaria]|uniref:Retrovirus-related Pol polyprotein from transposon TNT 1-94 n=1 Tax=Quillaja saponaria TaxID=32244 RepID=A0AAD7LSE9_QUISA|nr:Retrovirus-related Pol polyprotein from transposon TNT 1-94 [Quillaja saponaria]
MESSVGVSNVSYSVIPIFSGENYQFWKVKMKTLLLADGLWNIVEYGFNMPDNEEELSTTQKQKLDTDQMLDAKALSKIQNGVSPTIFPRIIRANLAKEAWKILEKEFHGDNKSITVKLQSLRRQFENLRMKDVEVVKDYFSKVIEIVNQMRTFGEVTNKKIVEPENYDSIVAAIDESKDLSTLSVEQLMGSLQSHEERRLKRNDEQIESVFRTKHFSKSKAFFKKDENQSKGSRQWKDKNEVKDEKGERDMTSNNSNFSCKNSNHSTSKC